MANLRSHISKWGCTILAVLVAAVAHGQKDTPRPFPNPFFAMCTGTSDASHSTVASQVAMLRELGYDGIDHMGTENVAETVREARAAGLGMFGIYVGVDIEPDASLPGGLREAISELKGTGAVVWVPLQSRSFKRSSPAGDADAVEKVRAIADLAAASGVKVALYPHSNIWLERVEDAVRVARKADRSNVGVTFNLCHWLKVSSDQDLVSILTHAMPYLTMVTINGADADDEWSWGWSRLIQTLDRGAYDTYRVLAVLRELGYEGPVGLQGYGIGGDVQDNLRRSKEAWDRLTKRLAGDTASHTTVDAWLPQVLTDETVATIRQFEEGDERATFSTLARRLREAPDRLRPALEERLIALLTGEGTADGKAQICRLLRDWGSEACIPVLGDLVNDLKVGPVALDALQAKAGRKTTEHLLDALDRADPLTAIAIMTTLGERRDDAAIAHLAAIAQTASGQLAEGALAALARIGSKAASKALIRLREREATRGACSHALVECAERLRAEGAPFDAAGLCDRLLSDSQSPAIHIAAMRGLALSAPGRGVRVVVDALKAEDAALRQAAAAMAAGMEGEQVTRAFCDALPSLPPDDRITVLHALSRRGDSLATAAIAAEARSGPDAVRPVALRALGALGGTPHLALLVDAAAGTNGAACRAAEEALATLKGAGVDSAMMTSVLTAQPAEKTVLIRALTERKASGAVPLFFHLANGDDEDVRHEATRAMGQLADGSYLSAVLTLLPGAEDEAERGWLARAAQAIAGRVRDADDRTNALLGAWHTAPAGVRAALLRLLGQFGGARVLGVVSEALESDDAEIRRAAVRSLAAWPDASAAEVLAGIAENSDDASERILALRGYIRVLGGGGARPPAETLVLYEKALALAERPEEKRQVLSGIACVPDHRTLDVIAACWKDEALAAEARMAFLQAAKLVGGMEPDSTRSRLREAIEEIDDGEFEVAAETVIDSLIAGRGQITSWMVAGPYGAAGENLFDDVYPPEEAAGTGVVWSAISAMDGPFTRYIVAGDVNLIARVGGSNCVAYLRAGLYVPESKVVSLELGSDDGIKAWINGELVHANDFRGALQRGRDKVTVHLEQGWNRLLLKVTQGTGEWGATARIVTPAGDPVPGLLFCAE